MLVVFILLYNLIILFSLIYLYNDDNVHYRIGMLLIYAWRGRALIRDQGRALIQGQGRVLIYYKDVQIYLKRQYVFVKI